MSRLFAVVAWSLAILGVPLVVFGLVLGASWLVPAGAAVSVIGVALLVLRHGPLVEDDIRVSDEEDQ